VEFAAKHLGMMTVRGHFADVTSTADIDPDHLERMRVEVTIQAASIKTHNQIRDNDLRSSNFLETDAFPVITFTSTRVEAAGEDRYSVTGDLTIKGNTRPVALQMTKLGEFNDPGWATGSATAGTRRSTVRTSACPSTRCLMDGSSSVRRSTSCWRVSSSSSPNRVQRPNRPHRPDRHRTTDPGVAPAYPQPVGRGCSNGGHLQRVEPRSTLAFEPAAVGWSRPWS
jgi:YceI-like domain